MRKEKKWFRGRMFTAFVVVLALVAAGCGGDDDDDDASSSDTTGSGSSAECGSVTVGSTNFSEQLIVASMFAQVLEAQGLHGRPPGQPRRAAKLCTPRS